MTPVMSLLCPINMRCGLSRRAEDDAPDGENTGKSGVIPTYPSILDNAAEALAKSNHCML
jgi:hypothetical protein